MNAQTHVLVHETTGETVKRGDAVKSFRNESFVLCSWTPPKHAGSTGRIYVRAKGDRVGTSREYFPSVCGLVIKECAS